jgi:hypothetical protein
VIDKVYIDIAAEAMQVAAKVLILFSPAQVIEPHAQVSKHLLVHDYIIGEFWF